MFLWEMLAYPVLTNRVWVLKMLFHQSRIFTGCWGLLQIKPPKGQPQREFSLEGPARATEVILDLPLSLQPSAGCSEFEKKQNLHQLNSMFETSLCKDLFLLHLLQPTAILCKLQLSH